nr:LamG domain-containing protein [Candidatus Woesearchaeota archaeon]
MFKIKDKLNHLGKKKWFNKDLLKLVLLVFIFLFIVISFVLLSKYNGADELDTIKVLNEHSYPKIHGNWTVEFETRGKSDLVIKGINGTVFGNDLVFLEIKCGNEALDYIKIEDGVLVRDYECSKGKEVSKLLTGGNHTLSFSFGGDIVYAFNQANNAPTITYTNISTTDFTTNNTNQNITWNFNVTDSNNNAVYNTTCQIYEDNKALILANWNFNINATDCSGFGNHGLTSGNFSGFTSGFYGNASNFNGTSGYINSTIKGFRNDTGSIEMWIKPNVNMNENRAHVFAGIQGEIVGDNKTQGLVALYHFNNNTNDSSGMNNQGVPFGGLNCGATTEGYFGTGCKFDSVNDYISVKTITLNNDEYTLSFWINDSFLSQSFLFDSSPGERLIISTVGGNWGGNNRAITVWMSGSQPNLGPTNSIPFGWVNIVVTFSGSNNLVVGYVNGIPTGTSTYTQTSIGTTTNIGTRDSADNDWWRGSLDEVAIYNRSLSADEVLEIYNAGAIIYKNSTGSLKFKIGNATLTANVTDWKKDQWKYIAGTWNTTTASLYVNGTLYSQQGYQSFANWTNNYRNNGEITIGAGYQGVNTSNASIDEVRIWNATLSPYDIYQHFVNNTQFLHSDLTGRGKSYSVMLMSDDLALTSSYVNTTLLGIHIPTITYTNISTTNFNTNNTNQNLTWNFNTINADSGYNTTCQIYEDSKALILANWNFNINATDCSGFGNHGIFNGSAGTTSFISGFYGNASNFTGDSTSNRNGGFINATIKGFRNDTGSIELWVKPNINMNENRSHVFAAIQAEMVGDNKTKGLVGLWHLNNNTNDSSGLGNTGVPNGAINCGVTVNGYFGTACNFSGSSGSNIITANSNSLRVQEHTLTAWVHPIWLAAVNRIILASVSDDITVSGIEWSVGGATSGLQFAYNDGAVRGWYTTSNSDLVVNQWQHVAFVWRQSAGQLDVYLNGVKRDTVSTTTGTIVYSSDTFRIGYQSQNTNFNGTIDEVAIYNRSLSADEVLEIYNAGALIYKNSTGSLKFKIGNATLTANVTDWKKDQWKYIAGTWNTTTASLYVNGTLYSQQGYQSFANWTNNYRNNGEITIGAGYQGVNTINASIDEVNLWNVTLSAYDIYQHFINNTQFLHSDLTGRAKSYSVMLMSDDLMLTSSYVNTSSLEILGAPSITYTNISTSDFTTNNTNQNITWNFNVTDPDGNAVYNTTCQIYEDSKALILANWNFNINATDCSGFGNHGLFNGSASFISGFYGNASNFSADSNMNRSGSYINATIKGFRNDTGSIEMWVKPNINMNENRSHIFASIQSELVGDNKTQGLVALYHLNNNTNDSSGLGNTGVPTNSLNCGATVNGYFGTACDSSKGYIDLGNPQALRLTDAMTISAWIYLNSTAVNNNRIVSKFGSQRGWELVLDDDPNNNLLMRIATTSSTYIDAKQSVQFQIGIWTHVAGTYDPGKSLRVYRDGILVGINTTFVPNSQFDSVNNVSIGARGDGLSPFNGTIDEVAIFNRSLNADEILELYNAGALIYKNSTGSLKFKIGNATLTANVTDWKKDQWKYIAGTWNTTTASLYVNGSLYDQQGYQSFANWTNNYRNNGEITIGAGYRGVNTSNASIDEVKLWNVTLSAYDIYQHFINNTQFLHSDLTNTGSNYSVMLMSDDLMLTSSYVNTTKVFITVNSAPSVPLLDTPSNNSNLSDNTPLLSWFNSTDADTSSALNYSIEVWNNSAMTSLAFMNISMK